MKIRKVLGKSKLLKANQQIADAKYNLFKKYWYIFLVIFLLIISVYIFVL